MNRYVLYCDDMHAYFIRLGLGIFWECSGQVKEARKFLTRAAAVKTMQAAGKHRQGWRVLKVAE